MLFRNLSVCSNDEYVEKIDFFKISEIQRKRLSYAYSLKNGGAESKVEIFLACI